LIILCRQKTARQFSADAIGSSAARHGADMLALGWSVSQVVHDYGDDCSIGDLGRTESRGAIVASG
jgi:hypothetical protein